MDLIYTDINGEDAGILHGYTLDEAYGDDENDFELTLDAYIDLEGCRIYTLGTEYGGVVDSLETDSGDGSIVFRGRTWHGILAKKILCPDSGKDYLTVSGDVGDILAGLIARMGLADMFDPPETTGVIIESYRFERYTDAYSGIRSMLRTVDMKLKMICAGAKIRLSAEPAKDYSTDEEWDSSQMRIRAKRARRSVNHLICLGSGNLSARTVIHKYADAAGNISGTQTLFGVDEICEVYDYPNVESAEELDRSGGKELRERIGKNGVTDTDIDTEETYDVDDVVGMREHITGMVVTRRISKKIVSIDDGCATEEYKLGE